eukprot:CAMPEP_0113966774 /NCGR_PEP_ID=MMETSP0011_2-20120614/8506_1 /TAXON_ID=101924 /ORGANISM="Rhodosorus marinus" /LENGTH=658 /DNA_ID=CAMNT_0000979473 /DNA_START=526 /DNA_END=2502 /DNA_ORIENTATION=+ /assembly_acc=CAM_ASM_000156
MALRRRIEGFWKSLRTFEKRTSSGEFSFLRMRGGLFLVWGLICALLVFFGLRLGRSPKLLATVFGTRCPYLLVEVGVRGGGDLLDLVSSGGILKEFSGATGISSSQFCVEAFEAHEGYSDRLREVENILLPGLRSIKVHLQSTVANFNGEAPVVLENVAAAFRVSESVNGVTTYNSEGSTSSDRERRMSKVSFHDLLDVLKRNGVTRYKGWSVVRVRSTFSDTGVYLRMILGDPRLCNALDEIVMEVIHGDSLVSQKKSDFIPEDVESELELLADLLKSSSSCTTKVSITYNRIEDPAGKEDKIFYAVLAGAKTLNTRVCASTKTWMRSVPHSSIAIFTNTALDVHDHSFRCLGGHLGVVASPAEPDGEKDLSAMQSWSHLVRVRLAWDLHMKDDASKQYMVLMDDDSFVFTDTLEANLAACMSPKALHWGGALEFIRIDNGDGGRDGFGKDLREKQIRDKAENCYFPGEQARNGLKPCNEVFCKRCKAIPQGGFVVLTRALVEALRPHIEDCERESLDLCERCGSQRLYFCINRKLGDRGVQLSGVRGVYRKPWKAEFSSQEGTAWHGYPVSIHGMVEGSSRLHKGVLENDFAELYELVRRARRRAAANAGDAYVTVEDMNFQIVCNGMGYFRNGKCYRALTGATNWCNTAAYTWTP